MEVTQLGALAILLGLMVIGELVAKWTKGKVPGALVITVLIMVGCWTILPKDLVARTGISTEIYTLCVVLLVTHLGTLISRKQMMSQWRTVLISLMGIVAICLITLTAGAAIFGWSNAVAATPPLTGAAVATTIMQQAAMAQGNTIAALVAIVCMVMQTLVGYPLGAFCLTREAKRLNGLYVEGKLPKAVDEDAEKAAKSGKKKQPSSTTFILLKLTLVALAAFYLEKLTGGYVSKYVWCLLLGFAAHELGLIESDALTKAKAEGILMTFLLVYLFGSMSSSTPEIILPVAGITISLVLMAAVGMALMAWVAKKVFKESYYMSYAIILNAFFGFPINVMLTNEAVAACSDDPEAQNAVRAQMLPKMLVAGFTSVTIVSVFVAGILVNFL
nr:hypothetical protein [Maliibacterium massiliense]